MHSISFLIIKNIGKELRVKSLLQVGYFKSYGHFNQKLAWWQDYWISAQKSRE